MFDLLIFFLSLLSIFVFMTVMFVFAIIIKNNGIIDICWSLNFVLATSVSLMWIIIEYRMLHLIQIIISALIYIWGFRLSYHIARRNIGKPEDKRYAERRESWGKQFYVKTFFLIFMLQALWAAVIVSPVVAVNSFYTTTAPNFIVINNSALEIVGIILGIIVWLVGFYFEAIGDRQLKNFIRNPENKGKIIESGLWKYTRHPNYFGEITMSWGTFIISLFFILDEAISDNWKYYFILFTIAGPIMYTLLIRYVTGVPEVEKHLIKKPGYEEYMKRTSVLFPKPPKKD